GCGSSRSATPCSPRRRDPERTSAPGGAVSQVEVVKAGVGGPAAAGIRRVYYGWVMVPVAVAAVVATSPGQTYSIAPFNESFRADLGLTHTQLTAAYMFGTLLAAVPLFWVGRAMDRHGLRRTTAAAVVLLGAACL